MSSEKRRAAAQLGSAAELYSDSEVYCLGTDRETLASWYHGATRVLDVATGAGRTADAIVDAGVSSVVATDTTLEMVTTAVREYLVADVVANAERLLSADDVLGAAACRIAAHHFPDPEAFVTKVVCAFGPDDVFAFEDSVALEDAALVAFLNGVEVLRDPTHVGLHPVSRWREWFAAAGLSVETVETAAIRLQLDPWTERANALPADQDELERRFRETSEETKKLFDMEFDSDSVASLVNLKVLVRARTRQVSRVAVSNPRPTETHRR